jgi:hypothetical protein
VAHSHEAAFPRPSGALRLGTRDVYDPGRCDVLASFAQRDNFLWPLVVAQTEDKHTLQGALAPIRSARATLASAALAGAVVIIIRILVISRSWGNTSSHRGDRLKD